MPIESDHLPGVVLKKQIVHLANMKTEWSLSSNYCSTASPNRFTVTINSQTKSKHMSFLLNSLQAQAMDSCEWWTQDTTISSEESIERKLEELYCNQWNEYEEISKQMGEKVYCCSWLHCHRIAHTCINHVEQFWPVSLFLCLLNKEPLCCKGQPCCSVAGKCKTQP